MPRFNVQHPVTKMWRCFSTIVDDWITEWMELEQYEEWRKEQYGINAGSVYDANIMELNEAESRIKIRGDEEDTE